MHIRGVFFFDSHMTLGRVSLLMMQQVMLQDWFIGMDKYGIEEYKEWTQADEAIATTRIKRWSRI